MELTTCGYIKCRRCGCGTINQQYCEGCRRVRIELLDLEMQGKYEMLKGTLVVELKGSEIIEATFYAENNHGQPQGEYYFDGHDCLEYFPEVRKYL